MHNPLLKEDWGPSYRVARGMEYSHTQHKLVVVCCPSQHSNYQEDHATKLTFNAFTSTIMSTTNTLHPTTLTFQPLAPIVGRLCQLSHCIQQHQSYGDYVHYQNMNFAHNAFASTIGTNLMEIMSTLKNMNFAHNADWTLTPHLSLPHNQRLEGVFPTGFSSPAASNHHTIRYGS